MKLLKHLLLTASFLAASSCLAEEPSTFRVALVQLNSSNAGNYDEMLNAAIEGKNGGADLVVFPESSAFGWLNPTVFTDAQPIPGDISDRFSKLAKKSGVWVAAGLAERGPKAGDGIYHAYDSAILLNPKGELVLHHRKNNVLRNAFNKEKCPSSIGTEGCSYTAGNDVSIANTPFGKTSLLVCADAYTYETSTLDKVKQLKPDVVIIPWGVAAEKQSQCGKKYYNATIMAANAARYLKTAHVIGANATGKRPYGRYQPSVYCGNSGYATPTGAIGGMANTAEPIVFIDIPRGQQ